MDLSKRLSWRPGMLKGPCIGAQEFAPLEPPRTIPRRLRLAHGSWGALSTPARAVCWARLCAGYGALSVLSVGIAADHRRHHAGRGDPADPPASETCRKSTPSCPGACPPGSLRLILRLTAPGGHRLVPDHAGSWVPQRSGLAIRLRPSMRPVGKEACPPASAYPHRALLLPVCRIPYLDSVLHARTPVHQSPAHARCLIVCISLSRRPSAAPTAVARDFASGSSSRPPE